MKTAHQEISLDDALKIVLRNMNAGNFRVAELALRDIISSVPDHYESMYLLGMANYHMGNTQEALIHLKNACDSEEVDTEWLSNYGVICNELGLREQAVAAYDKAIKMEPRNGMLHWNKCYVLWLMGRFKESEKAGRKAVKVSPDSPEAWLNLGAALVKNGKLAEAMECWEKTIELKPDFAFAWNNLGNGLRDLGKLKESEEKCLKALEIDPNYVEALNNLANVYLDRGRYEKAEEYYRKAIANRPDYAEAHNNLAVTLMNMYRFAEAATHCRYAISFKEDYPEAYINLSEATRNLGQVDEARKAIEQAALLRPDSAEVHMDLADVLYMQDKFADAEVELNIVEKLKPENPRTYIKLANVQERAGNTEKALNTIDKAVELNPEMPEAYLRKGQIYLTANMAEAAEKNYKKAIEMAPKHPGVYLAMAELHTTLGNLKKAETYVKKVRKLSRPTPGLFQTITHLKKLTKDDEDFKMMKEMEKHIENYGLEQSSILNFALFKAYENVGQYKKAFAALKKGNECKRKLIPYQKARSETFVENIKKIYTPKFLSSLEGLGYKSKMPIFIVGMPRSGTTLTEQIISSHPDVFGAGELLELGRAENAFGPLTPENCKEMGALYVKRVKKLDKTKKAKHITDKMPGNYANIGMIASILPHAKIIHCRRDPIDTCLSCYKQNFARGQYWSYNLEELAEQYKLYEELMDYWREVLPGRFLEINYEETVNNFEEQAHKLIDYIDLPWHKACLAPHKQKRAVLTASKTQVIKPIYKSSVKSWKRYEEQLQPLINGLGIETPKKKKTPAKKAAKKTVKKTVKKTAKKSQKTAATAKKSVKKTKKKSK